MILFFDTETTGLVDFKKPANDPSQPRLVQLGAILSDDEGKELAIMDCLIKPVGFCIPDNMVHGISHDEAVEKGVIVEEAIETFGTLYRMNDVLVAHNIKFDQTIIQGEVWRITPNIVLYNGFCTMLASTSLVGARQPNGRPKWPKLSEAYKFFFNEELIDAHDALTDVRACKRIYFELLRRHSPQNNQVTDLENAI